MRWSQLVTMKRILDWILRIEETLRSHGTIGTMETRTTPVPSGLQEGGGGGSWVIGVLAGGG